MAHSFRIRPLDAWRAIRALLRNPDDTARVFDVIDALAGNNRGRMLRRLRRSPDGPRLLRERPDLLARLSDRERLKALPEGSLGRCYAEFVYGRDLIGEASLLAFTYAQTRNRGIGFIVAVAYWRAGGDLRSARAVMRRAWWRGRPAAWLPGQDWERLLARPLAEVRRELRLGEAATYTELRSEGAPVLT